MYGRSRRHLHCALVYIVAVILQLEPHVPTLSSHAASVEGCASCLQPSRTCANRSRARVLLVLVKRSFLVLLFLVVVLVRLLLLAL